MLWTRVSGHRCTDERIRWARNRQPPVRTKVVPFAVHLRFGCGPLVVLEEGPEPGPLSGTQTHGAGTGD